jgi:hypothetical protein
MAEHESPKPEPRLPEDEDAPQREAGDRPVPTPGRVGNLPDEDGPVPGLPIAFPPSEPR